jgi:formate dehydrogenase
MGLPGPLAMLGTPDNPDPGPIDVADRFLRSGPWGDAAGVDGLSVAVLRERYPHGARFLDRVDAAKTLDMIDWPDGKVRLWGEVQAGELARLLASGSDDSDALLLFGRRRLQGLNSWMHNSERLTRGYAPTLQINPADAATRGIADGATVRVASRVNAMEVLAEVTDEVVAGSVCYPHGWGHNAGWQRANGLGGGNVNLLASDDPADWEQVTGICLLDGIPVTVGPVAAAGEKADQDALNMLASK